MDNITKINICYSLYRQGISPEKIPEEINVHRATVYRWIKKMKRDGITTFKKNYITAKKGRRQRKTDPALKQKILALRRSKRNCCGQKIKFYLRRDHNLNISVSTIYRILNQEYKLRKKWKAKYQKRGKVIRKGERPRQFLQVDTVDLGSLYAFTAIDTYTREASVILKKRLTAKAGEEALIQQIKIFGKVEGIQRDGGSEFKKEWEKKARKYAQRIRTAKPYKKNEQAFIERFNGTLRKECVGWLKYRQNDLSWLQKKVEEFLYYYHHDRPHMGLDMQTPHQFSMSHLT